MTTRRDRVVFQEGDEWTRDGANPTFERFAFESGLPGFTPFDTFGSLGYRFNFRNGFGDHPVMDYTTGGSRLTPEDLEQNLSDPLFPPL